VGSYPIHIPEHPRVNYLKIFIQSTVMYWVAISPVFSAIVEAESKQQVSTVSYTHVLNWSLGLIIVLAVFFSCVWLMKKMGALPVNNKNAMKVIGGLSLGMREKLVLVQIGDKQLVLGVAPGKIDKLLVLEGEDRLFQQVKREDKESDFSDKFKQIMSGSNNE